MQAPRTNRLREVARPAATLRSLAERADVSYSLVTKVAAGVRKPNEALREAAEDLYGIPAGELFGEQVARPRRRCDA